MQITSAKGLKVYQMTYALAMEIFRNTSIPRGLEEYPLFA